MMPMIPHNARMALVVAILLYSFSSLIMLHNALQREWSNVNAEHTQKKNPMHLPPLFQFPHRHNIRSNNRNKTRHRNHREIYVTYTNVDSSTTYRQRDGQKYKHKNGHTSGDGINAIYNHTSNSNKEEAFLVPPTLSSSASNTVKDKERYDNGDDNNHIGTEFNATIVVQLSGMMGNILGKIAHGYGLKWRLEQDYGLGIHQNSTVNLWLHQTRDKWQLRARKSLLKCFPFSRQFHFDHGGVDGKGRGKNGGITNGIHDEFRSKLALQESLFGKNAYHGVKDSEEKVSLALEKFINDARGTGMNVASRTLLNSTSTSTRTIVIQSAKTNETISLPFLHSNFMIHIEFDKGSRSFLQRFYAQYKKLFQFNFDDPLCCNPNTIPDPDESVFHFRNFKKELNNPKQKRFPELGPNQIAQEVLGHLNAGDKVAMISRIHDEYVEEHVQALRRRGLVVRVVQGNSGEQDFCFLMQATKEILGSDKSTFFFWAGVLGNAKKVRLHSIGPNYRYSAYDSPKELKDRFLFSNHDVNTTLDPEWTLVQ
jgi:hypothetical protein